MTRKARRSERLEGDSSSSSIAPPETNLDQHDGQYYSTPGAFRIPGYAAGHSSEQEDDDDDDSASQREGFNTQQEEPPYVLTATLAPWEVPRGLAVNRSEQENDHDDTEDKEEAPFINTASTTSDEKWCTGFSRWVWAFVMVLILAVVAIVTILLLLLVDVNQESNASKQQQLTQDQLQEIYQRLSCPGIQKWQFTPPPLDDFSMNNTSACVVYSSGCDTAVSVCAEFSLQEAGIFQKPKKNDPHYVDSANRARCPGLQRYSPSPVANQPCPEENGCDTSAECPDLAFHEWIQNFSFESPLSSEQLNDVFFRLRCPGIQRWEDTPPIECITNKFGCDTALSVCEEFPLEESNVIRKDADDISRVRAAIRNRCPGIQRYSFAPMPEEPCPIHAGCDTAGFCPELPFVEWMNSFSSS